MGFWALRERAAPAAPALRAAIDDAALARGAREAAVQAISYIGTNGIPLLLNVIAANRQSNPSLAHFTIATLASIDDLGSNRPAAGALFRECLKNRDPGVASSSASALIAFRLQPELSVPALINCLHGSSPIVQVYAANALAEFGPDAKDALPILVPWLTNRDERVRAAATYATAKIAPESNTEAPVLRSRTAEGGQRTQK
jgi:HEAT repeat protein